MLCEEPVALRSDAFVGVVIPILTLAIIMVEGSATGVTVAVVLDIHNLGNDSVQPFKVLNKGKIVV